MVNVPNAAVDTVPFDTRLPCASHVNPSPGMMSAPVAGVINFGATVAVFPTTTSPVPMMTANDSLRTFPNAEMRLDEGPMSKYVLG